MLTRPMPARRVLTLTALAVIAVAAVIRASHDRTAPEAGFLPHDGARLTARGAQIHAAQCTDRHGARLEVEPDWKLPGPDGRLGHTTQRAIPGTMLTNSCSS